MVKSKQELLSMLYSKEGGINIEEMEICFAELDAGHNPITEGWEDGRGHTCTENGWHDDIIIVNEDTWHVRDIKTHQIVDLFATYEYNEGEIEELLYLLAMGSGIETAEMYMDNTDEIYYKMRLTDAGFDIVEKWREDNDFCSPLEDNGVWHLEYVDELEDSVKNTLNEFGIQFVV